MVLFAAVNAVPFVTLLFQVYVEAPDPAKVTEAPLQTVWSVPASTVGNALTTTWADGVVIVLLFIHPLVSWTLINV